MVNCEVTSEKREHFTTRVKQSSVELCWQGLAARASI